MSMARSLILLPLIIGATRVAAQAPSAAPPYLYVWAASADSTRPGAFLAVFDIRAGSPTAGQIVRVIAAGPGVSPHHTEHQLEQDGVLFANDFGDGPDIPVRPVQAGRPEAGWGRSRPGGRTQGPAQLRATGER